jgi:hypothetical protein
MVCAAKTASLNFVVLKANALGICHKCSEGVMEAGKNRRAGDSARAANTDEVKEPRLEAKDLKEAWLNRYPYCDF